MEFSALFCELDNLRTKMGFLESALLAIEDGMENGSHTSDVYAGGLVLVLQVFHDMRKELNGYIEEGYQMIRAESEGKGDLQ